MSRARDPGGVFVAERLMSPAEGIAAFLRAVTLPPPIAETVPLGAAAGRILAADAVARTPFPAEPRSTMDGFAVRSADGIAPRRIAGAVLMGVAPPTLAAGEALRIPTGGVLPADADAVVPLEDAEEAGDVVRPRESPAAGAYYTPAGEDMRPGDLVISAGRRIGAPELSVLATLGIVEVPVYRRPAIAIISTGDELIDPGAVPARGQIRDSNRWAVAGALTALGCDVVHIERARDEVASVRARIVEALARADGVLLTGGSSVGARDAVPAAIDELGAPGVIVHGLRVKPGKPTVLAAVGARPVIGLPGNPTSALAIFEAIASEILRVLTGETQPRRATAAARAAAAFTGRAGWTWYVPAVIGADGARPLALRSSHTSLLARADGYVVVGPERDRIEPGEPVTVIRYGVWA